MGAAAAEQLASGEKLRVHFKPDYRFIFHIRNPGSIPPPSGGELPVGFLAKLKCDSAL